MSLGEQVFRYCERGQDASLWAEPFNATSNLAILGVAAAAALRWRRDMARAPGATARAEDRSGIGLLIALTACVGLGSLLFHTFATRWARLADVIPIGLFMLGYLAFALRRYLGWSRARTLVALGVFLGLTALAASVSCPRGLAGITTYAREPCLKGTMGYAPALAALLLTGATLRSRHPAGRALLLAAGLFLMAMLLRWMDMRACPWTVVLGQPRGTHALWHLLNAATLHVLLGAALASHRGARLAA